MDHNHPQSGMRTFWIIWAGQLISLLGSGLTSFALGVWIYEQIGEATPFALTVLFGSLPQILLLPLAGSLADRWDRRWMMILADTGAAVITLVVFIFLLVGNLQVWMIYLMAALGSVFGALQQPAYMASVTMLVPKQELTRASGLSDLGQAIGGLITPAAAGFLFVAIGLRGIILIDFITYFFAVGALLVVRIPQPKLVVSPGENQKKPSALTDAVIGWRYLRQRSGLFILLWYYALVNFLLNFSVVLLGPMVLARHTAREFGLVQMAMGLGTLAGSLLLSAWGGPKGRKMPTVIGFIALGAVGLMIGGVSASVVTIGLGMFLLLFSVPLASGPSRAIFQVKVAHEVQGRVFAIRNMISRSIMPLAFLLAGPLADRVLEPSMRVDGALGMSFLGELFGTGAGRGIGLGFVVSGLCLLVVTGFAYANPHLRNLDAEIPDAL